MATISVQFDQSDGVVPGAHYTCRVKLTAAGHSSGWGYPATVYALTVLGMAFNII